MSRCRQPQRSQRAAIRPPARPKNYFQAIGIPFYSLVFLLPAVAFFEIGELLSPFGSDRLSILQQMFEPFGARGRLSPRCVSFQSFLAGTLHAKTPGRSGLRQFGPWRLRAGPWRFPFWLWG